MRPRSLVSVAFTSSAAPAPETRTLPRWLTSNTPTRSRTAVCSSSTPPGYCSGISQPPNSANFAPAATCRSCNGERRTADMAGKLPEGRRPAGRSRPHSIAAMPSLVLRTDDPARFRTAAVVVGVQAPTAAGGAEDQASPTVAPGAASVAEAYGERLGSLLAQLGMSGKLGETVTVPSVDGVAADLVVFVGLGSEVSETAVRRAAGAAARALKKSPTVAL